MTIDIHWLRKIACEQYRQNLAAITAVEFMVMEALEHDANAVKPYVHSVLSYKIVDLCRYTDLSRGSVCEALRHLGMCGRRRT